MRLLDRIDIREATSADAAGIATVHIESWQEAYLGLLPAAYLARMSDRRLRRRWRHTLLRAFREGGEVLVAEVDARVVGFAQLMHGPDHATGELSMLYVLPAYQGRGVGRLLLRRAADRLLARGYRRLLLGVLAGNVRARAFYERQGLAANGRFHLDPIGGGMALVMGYEMALNPFPRM